MHHNVPDATSLRRSVRWGYNTGDTWELDREHSLYWVLLNGCVEIHENLIENSWCTSEVLEMFNILPCLFSTTQKLDRQHSLYWVLLSGCVEKSNLLPCLTRLHYTSRTYNAVLLNLQWIDQERRTQNTWTQHSYRNPGHSRNFIFTSSVRLCSLLGHFCTTETLSWVD